MKAAHRQETAGPTSLSRITWDGRLHGVEARSHGSRFAAFPLQNEFRPRSARGDANQKSVTAPGDINRVHAIGELDNFKLAGPMLDHDEVVHNSSVQEERNQFNTAAFEWVLRFLPLPLRTTRNA